MDNIPGGYLDIDVSIQGDINQVETQMAENLDGRGLGSPEYTASFLATADDPCSIPRKLIKRNVWVGIRAENPDIDSIGESYFEQQDDLTEDSSRNNSEDDQASEEPGFGYVEIRSSIEKYLDQAVPTVNGFEKYGAILDDARDDFTADESELSYFVTAQAAGSGLSEAISRLERSGMAGLKIESPDEDPSWHVYDVKSDSLYEVPEITAKHSSDL